MCTLIPLSGPHDFWTVLINTTKGLEFSQDFEALKRVAWHWGYEGMLLKQAKLKALINPGH